MDNAEQARRRDRTWLPAPLVIIVLAGTLLLSRFIRNAAIMKCVTSGRQGCVERIVAAPRP